ncbi:unnamed protein product [Rhodiola kirilowii]
MADADVCFIQTEIAELNTDSLVGSSTSPKGDNLYHWIATIIGPPETPYEDG